MLLLPVGVPLEAIADAIRADASVVTLTAFPSDIRLPANGEPISIEIVAANAGRTSVYNLQLTWLSTPGLTLELDDASSTRIQQLVPGQQSVWTLSISQDPKAQASESLSLRLNYETSRAKRDPASPQVIFATPTVTTTPLSVDQIAGVQVQSSADKVDENRAGIVFLVITNKATFAIEAWLLPVRKPDFLTTQVGGSNIAPVPGRHDTYRLILESGESNAFEIDVKSEGRVEHGQQLLAFPLRILWGSTNARRSASLLMTKSVTVGTFGEDAVLSAFGITSFLLLPGFLLLVTVSLLWKARLLRPPGDTMEFPWDAKSAEFWVIAITLSILLAGAFVLVGRSYLVAYGISDVLIVWAVSVGLGTACYVTWRLARNRWLSNRTPGTDDDGIAILRKLHRQHLGLMRPRVEIPGQAPAGTINAYLLQPLETHRDRVWVSPHVVVTWRDPAKPEDATLEPLVQEARDKDDVKALARLFQKWSGTNKPITVSWGKQGWLDRPKQVASATLKESSSAEIIQVV